MTYRVFDKQNVKNLDLYYTPAPNSFVHVNYITKAYLLGALHDSTTRKYTFRISQKSKEYVNLIAKSIKLQNSNAWVYKEGKNRNVYIVEFAKKFLKNCNLSSRQDEIDYIRGYFDTDGSIPNSLKSRYYIYFAQKNHTDLLHLRNLLLNLGINCGSIHNPSKSVDLDYFRFYVLTDSLYKFSILIGSSHPVKSKFIRMKI